MNYSNSDLAPIVPKRRNWSTLNYVALWVGIAVCIPSYMMAASLVSGGMNAFQAIFTVFLGNAIVLVPIVLTGHVGTKYGIPFPVFARASFGVKGSNIPALLRAFVACGWFGIQTWIGGAALYAIIHVFWPGTDLFPRLMPDFIGIGFLPFLCFITFWIVNMLVIWRGIDTIRILEAIAAPFLILAGLILLFWANSEAGGFGALLTRPSKFDSLSGFLAFFFPALTGMIGFWATLSINIPDFTRFARNQKSQIIGQAVGLPFTMTLFAFIGVAVTGATVVIYGEAIWDPIVLIGKFKNGFVVCAAMIAILLATLSTNVAANVVSPANDFSNLSPSRISFKMGGTITGVIGILMMPWKLLADPSGYIFTWLIGYSALLGPIGGILIVDYYLIRRCELVVDELYVDSGRYWYGNGFNPWAIAALTLGILPNLPGFFIQIKLIDGGSCFWTSLYHYAWFTGLFIAGASYYFMMREKKVLLGLINRIKPRSIQLEVVDVETDN